ncbi:uncharacterized protein LOC111714738 isoform X2 [Eurytemora carolleeae]|uniref:uncharacterized protein LOC111714738 isoform X2 n=1 Tax=Eurytemora carolleeae TaxID=1294199 RepID=UPI000C794E40|nr:uncharacterized protein LOC111714738 isoform X2 [Eurytemora carolleeae]|eukprot:XP_023345671.1 uncharacterized protein LOC111714738 isoform X2 [Eurytemora affinis]
METKKADSDGLKFSGENSKDEEFSIDVREGGNNGDMSTENGENSSGRSEKSIGKSEEECLSVSGEKVSSKNGEIPLSKSGEKCLSKSGEKSLNRSGVNPGNNSQIKPEKKSAESSENKSGGPPGTKKRAGAETKRRGGGPVKGLVPVSTRGGKPANVLTGVRSMGGGGVRTGRVQVGLGAMGGPATRAGQGGGARIGRGPTNGTHGNEEGRERTPETIIKNPYRGSSTPTEGEYASVTVLDSWDASRICTFPGTQTADLLNETAPVPVSSLPFLSNPGASANPGDLESTLLPEPTRPGLNTTRKTTIRGRPRPQTTYKPRNPAQTAFKVANTAFKPGVVFEETLDPEDMSEEEYDLIYSRYIQSQYILLASKKALERTEKECERKLFEGWRLLEEKRYQTITNMQELVNIQLISDIQDILNTLGPIVLGTKGHEREGEEDGGEDGGGLKSQLLNTGNMMVELLDGLQNLDHNIQVKGVSIDPRERQKTIDAIKSLLKTFNARIPESADKSQTLNKMEMISRFCESGERMSKASDLCSTLIQACQRLAMKEASLKLSFKNLQPPISDPAPPQG